MKPNVSPIERAFELARSGRCRTTTEIKQVMKSEGYVVETLTGGTLLKQLRGMISAHSPEITSNSPRG